MGYPSFKHLSVSGDPTFELTTVHVGGDNYSDKPSINGAGGARLACGVIH